MTDDRKIGAEITKLMESVSVLPVPDVWLRQIANHNAVLLLADILAAYVGQVAERATHWDGNELILDCKHITSRLGISDRSITRALRILSQLEPLMALPTNCRHPVFGVVAAVTTVLFGRNGPNSTNEAVAVAPGPEQ